MTYIHDRDTRDGSRGSRLGVKNAGHRSNADSVENPKYATRCPYYSRGPAIRREIWKERIAKHKKSMNVYINWLKRSTDPLISKSSANDNCVPKSASKHMTVAELLTDKRDLGHLQTLDAD